MKKKTLHKNKNKNKNKKRFTKTKKIKQNKYFGIGGNDNIIEEQNIQNIFTKPELRTLFQEEQLDYILPQTNFTQTNIINNLAEDLIAEIEEEEAPLLYFDEAIEEYQNFSYNINGFLRNIVDYYSNKSIAQVFRDCHEDFPNNDKKLQIELTKCIKQNISKTLKIINTFDFIFENKLCPTFTNKTVLFRGTEQPYQTESTEQINKAYLSTTKTLDNLFVMQKKGDKILSKNKTNNKGCCINILLVDAGIPYLDLELPENEWNYQQEILLPRNLAVTLIGEDKYTYETTEYTVFVFTVKLYNTNKYIAPEIILNFDLIQPKKMIDLLTRQKDLIFALISKIQNNDSTDSNNVINIITNIEIMLDDYSLKVIKYFCSKEKYISICKYILGELQKMNKIVIEKHLEQNDYTESYNSIVSYLENSIK